MGGKGGKFLLNRIMYLRFLSFSIYLSIYTISVIVSFYNQGSSWTLQAEQMDGDLVRFS